MAITEDEIGKCISLDGLSVLANKFKISSQKVVFWKINEKETRKKDQWDTADPKLFEQIFYNKKLRNPQSRRLFPKGSFSQLFTREKTPEDIFLGGHTYFRRFSGGKSEDLFLTSS